LNYFVDTADDDNNIANGNNGEHTEIELVRLKNHDLFKSLFESLDYFWCLVLFDITLRYLGNTITFTRRLIRWLLFIIIINRFE